MKLREKEHGQGIVEVVLILALVSTAATLTLQATGVSVSDLYSEITCSISQTQDCNGLFHDDFENKDDWIEVSGNWETSDGELCGGPGEGRIFSDIEANDYTIKVNSANLAQGNGYGIYFRASDYEAVDAYVFQYDPGWGGGAFLFRKIVGGNELPPMDVVRTPGFDFHGEDHDIQVVVKGDTFTAIVDGVEVLQVSDDSYSEGGIGLRTWNGTKVCIDSVTVTP